MNIQSFFSAFSPASYNTSTAVAGPAGYLSATGNGSQSSENSCGGYDDQLSLSPEAQQALAGNNSDGIYNGPFESYQPGMPDGGPSTFDPYEPSEPFQPGMPGGGPVSVDPYGPSEPFQPTGPCEPPTNPWNPGGFGGTGGPFTPWTGSPLPYGPSIGLPTPAGSGSSNPQEVTYGGTPGQM